jgi:hypothetical protein
MTKHQRSILIRQIMRRELTPQPETTCDAWHSRYTGPVKCYCKPLRIITYISLGGDPVTGEFCAKHALELRRDEARGRLEILSDEAAGIPFEGEPLHNKEILTQDINNRRELINEF